MSSDQTHLRKLARSGEPFNPVLMLRALAKQDAASLGTAWRTGNFKELRELTDACLFAHGLGTLFGCEVTVLHGESEDYDFVLRRVAPDGIAEVMSVQHKELPPEALNPTITLTILLAKQARHIPTETVLLVRLNRTGHIPDEQLSVSELPFAELWFLWAAAPDGSRWCIQGGPLHEQRTLEFAYPV